METTREAKRVVSDVYRIYLEYSQRKYDNSGHISPYHRTVKSLSVKKDVLEKGKHQYMKSLAANPNIYSSREMMIKEIKQITFDNHRMRQAIAQIKEQHNLLKGAIDTSQIQLSHFRVNLMV